MSLLKKATVRLRRWWNPDRHAAEVDEELRFHIDMEARDLMRQGVAPGEARRRAERAFGSFERFKDEARDAGALPRLEGVWLDARHALRQMRHNPGFTAVAVLTLALGLGANVAMFSVIDSVLLRPLPYAEPDELVVLNEYPVERGVPAPGSPYGASWPNFVDWRDWPGRSAVFEDMALEGSTLFLLLGPGEPMHVRAHLVTPNYFRMLGVPAVRGRVIEPGEPADTVVLSESLWREQFAADPAAIGTTVRLDGEAFVIVGVVPRWLEQYTGARLWIRLTGDNDPFLQRRDFHSYGAVARLADGVSLQQAQSTLLTMRDALAETYPEANEAWSVRALPLYDDVVGPVRPTLLLLFDAVGLLMLVACANVAQLVLARATGRRRETAMRAALGAGRPRIVQQLVVENVMLALLGGLVGLLFGAWGTRAIVALTPSDIPRLDEPAAGATIVLFAVGLSVVTGLLFGLAPIVQSCTRSRISALHEGSAAASPGRESRGLRRALVVAEVALSLVLLVAAGLLISSFAYLWGYDAGFEADNVLTMEVIPVDARYPQFAQQAALYDEIYARLRQIPQIEAVGGNTRLPVGSGNIEGGVEGQGSMREEPALLVNLRPISGDYFAALRIPVLAGRAFRNGETGAVILNVLAARELWPDEPPSGVVGRSVRFSRRNGTGPWLRVVGVVGATRHGGLDPDPRPEVYQPHAERGFGLNVIVMRTRGDPLDIAALAREAVHAVDPEQPVDEIRTMRQIVADSMRRPRFYAALFATFGALALLMATAGVFAMAAYSTSRRRREIGVRMAIGARAADVVRMIAAEGLVLVAVGLALGLAASLALGRQLSDLLYGVSATDPVTLALAAALLAAAALGGFWLPARRASRVDPTESLRLE